MIDPIHITALTLTYARQQWLEECIACFLSQDWVGSMEMLIWNSYLPQRLHGEFPNVRIINATSRAPNLGACRNQAIAEAKEGLIVILDDDDACTTNHLSNFGKHWEAGLEWIWQSHQWYMLGYRLEKIVSGTPNTLAFTKEAWRNVGGYPEMNVGEDRALLQKLMGRPGKKVQMSPRDVSLVYSFGQGVYHFSGLGDDKPGLKPSHDRIKEYSDEQLEKGYLQSGDITLKPELLHDYDQMAKDWIARSTRHDVFVKKNDVRVPQPGEQPAYVTDLEPLKPLPKVTLVYIYVPGDAEHASLAGRFLHTYQKCPPGIPHDTVIICQGKTADAPAIKLFRGLPNASFYVHDDSGWDVGAFIAVSGTLDCDFALYCGGKTHFKRGGWMVRMVEAWKRHGPGFYGCTSSYEVSPHLNTSSFWCRPQAMVSYPHKVVTTADRYNFEHGALAMWLFCVRTGMPAKLVTWCGEYDWPDWRKPDNIYRRGDQSNCLCYFKHTDLYQESLAEMKPMLETQADTLADMFYIKSRSRGNLQLQPYGWDDTKSWEAALVNLKNSGVLAGRR
jgi:hypothetical protein